MKGKKKLIVFIAVLAFAFICGCEDQTDGCDGPDNDKVTVTGPITGGKGFPWNAALLDLSKRGYVEEEYFYEGEAASYQVEGEQTPDGKWTVTEADKAPYKTRLVVRRPVDPSKFNGTVIVEWFNVSAGADGSPGWMFQTPLIFREGCAWVGVSAQKVGVDGNKMKIPFGGSLVIADPERYESLYHPGDSYCYDIFTTAAKIIKGEGTMDVMSGLKPEILVAYGESQSAGTLITYTNAVQPVAKIFDGIFIHSRGAGGHPLNTVEGGCGLPSMSVDADDGLKVRTDTNVPIFQFETEGDMVQLGFWPARQPDTDKIRTWEVAGTAHADAYLSQYVYKAELEDRIPEAANMLACPDGGNQGPQWIVVRAAFQAFEKWVKDGIAPPTSAQLEMDGAKIIRDENGNAKGGIRTPDVDVPISTLHPTASLASLGGGEGAGCDMEGMGCMIFGETIPFSAEKLLELYPTHEDYVTKFKASADAAVAAGFMLEPERDEIVTKAEAAAVPN